MILLQRFEKNNAPEPSRGAGIAAAIVVALVVIGCLLVTLGLNEVFG